MATISSKRHFRFGDMIQIVTYLHMLRQLCNVCSDHQIQEGYEGWDSDIPVT